MQFNSLTFLLFFLVVFILCRLPIAWKAKKLILMVSSYLFYAAWNPILVLILFACTLVSWADGEFMDRPPSQVRKRFLLAIGIIINLGLLAYFKYADFFLSNLTGLLKLLNVSVTFAKPGIVLPIGISFYIFRSLSYNIDVYRGKIKAWPSFLDYALYVSFFPQLLAGPIVRPGDFLPQLAEPKKANSDQLGWGFALLAIGIFQKQVLCDFFLAPVADKVFNAVNKVGLIDAWTGAVAFTGQIFFDFSAYSTCAIGVGMCLGFSTMDNFKFPYAAVGFQDFWRRWHISLSSWLRDYLYISLGGNRRGELRTYVNLLMTMLLGGLWHGAAWRFVAWGGLHGIFLATERLAKKYWGNVKFFQELPARIFFWLLTYAGVCVAWVFFRADSFGRAFRIISSMFSGGLARSVVLQGDLFFVTVITAGLLVAHRLLRDSSLEDQVKKIPLWLRAVILALIIILAMLGIASGDYREFIYFQF
jgi:alginate O-acetyltransferase complex protein AlgI